MDDQNSPKPQAQPNVPAAPDFTTAPQPESVEQTQPVTSAQSAQPMAGFGTATDAATPPVAPAQQPAQAFGAPQGTPPTAPKKMKKGLLAIIIAAAAVLLLGGGSALAYNLWYQNSQKVVTDGIVKMMTAKSMTYTATLTSDQGKDNKVEVITDGAVNAGTGLMNVTVKTNIDGKDLTVTGAGVFDDKGDLYVKVGNVSDIVNEFKTALPSSMMTTVDAIVTKVDNKWIKVSADDLKSVSDDASKVQTCVSKTINEFSSDKKANKELGDLYAKNQFIKIDKKLGSKDGSLGYSLKADGTKTKAFVSGLKDTKIYKDLNACDKTFTIDEKDLGDVTDKETNNEVIVEMWVNRWSHQITNITIKDGPEAKSDSKSTLIFEPKVGDVKKIETPKDSITIKDLTKDIEDLMNDFTNPYATPDYNYDSDYDYSY